MNRRSLILGAAGLIASPRIIRTPGLLMPVKPVRAAATCPALAYQGGRVIVVQIDMASIEALTDRFRRLFPAALAEWKDSVRRATFQAVEET